MKRTLTAMLVLGAASLAMTLGSFSTVFHKVYNVDKGSNLDKANCLVCHVKKSGGKLNPYGTDLQKEMKEEKSRKITPEILKAVEKLDSNKNGKTNLEDIKADKLPGD